MLTKEFYIRNRTKLFNKMVDNSVAVFVAGDCAFRSEDEGFKFTPNRNFFYLTGVDEPKDILVMKKSKGICEEFMYIGRFDPAKSRWVGKTFDEKEIEDKSGITKTYYIDEFESTFSKEVNLKKLHLYMDFNNLLDDPTHLASKDFYKQYFNDYDVEDVYPLVAELRLVKEKEELDEMRKAIHITNIALEACKKELKPGNSENDLDAMFMYQIFKNGASDFAFKSIVASGEHGCTLHYSENKDVLKDNDLCLFDVGAAYNYYSADISRTYPINGKFTPRQKQIYDIVRAGQEVVFKAAKPGVTTRDLNNALVEFYKVELKKIGLIKEDSELTKYYFHGVSHHLGLDTHDVCFFNGRARDFKLVPGCVITVEPGLYIEEERIGIRIEDDVVITETGCEVLSKEIAK